MVNKVLANGLALAALWMQTANALSASLEESLDGDLSETAELPTPWTLELGSNQLVGRAGKNTALGTEDYDLTAITIQAGQQLDSIVVTSYLNQDEFAIAFFALQAGSTWLDNLGGAIDGHALMGWAHIDSSMTGIDLLQEIQSHASDPPFEIPLPQGVYTMLIQDIDTTFDYSLSFNVSHVPEPSSATLAALGVIAFRLRRSRMGISADSGDSPRHSSASNQSADDAGK